MINEQAPECCPFCGAGKTNGVTLISGGPRYECGTYAVYGPEKNVRDFQSPRCAATERERLTRERDEAKERMAIAIADRDTARGRAEQVWKLREEFVGLLATDDIQKGVEAVRSLLARIKRLEEAGDAMAMSPCCCVCDGPCEHVPLVESWNAAKEAKP